MTSLTNLPAPMGSINLPSYRGKVVFSIAEIVRLEASSNYTRIYFVNHFSILTTKVLKTFEPELLPFGFLRIHRRHLVNQQFIREVCGDSRIIMKDHSVATISKRKKDTVLYQLQHSNWLTADLLPIQSLNQAAC